MCRFQIILRFDKSKIQKGSVAKLGGCRERNSYSYNNKQKTRTGSGYYSSLNRYESLHLCDFTAVYGTVRTVV